MNSSANPSATTAFSSSIPSGPASLIGIPASTDENELFRFHKVAAKYVEAVIDMVGGIPILVPAIGDTVDMCCLAPRLDGLLLTGGRANVEPDRYGGPPSDEETPHDPARDATTLPLIRAAVDCGIPVLAICLGIQELNVAFGGTLHQKVHEIDGKRDHRMRRDLPRDKRFDERHPIYISSGGHLDRLLGGVREVMVNSLHGQAVDRPGDGVFVEAVSDDGVIEAISIPDARALTLGVQWHPEHPTIRETSINRLVFEAFGEAVRTRRERGQAESIGLRAA